MCILAAAPFAACGFFSYHGMTAEQLLWAWFKSEVLCPRRLVFRSDCLYYQAMRPAIMAGTKPKKKHTTKQKKKRGMPMKKATHTQPENPGV